ncbi:glutathione S-transferase [Linnemannia elongata AG-77]|uniref:Glutathione S-transferase n=1 Tax=Linnemannia elongata AG-77 TaxID=1314771 RepID=A0A197KDL0_9FUNG|nr:glutathione S-transferase [Linnemannia elongata AG-77]
MTAPKLVLYNSDACPYAARAVIALAETNQDHEVIPIDLSVPRPEWYLKDINPYGQVPALKIDDKDIILESLFVAEYIADLHPESGLLPKDPLQRAQTRYLIHHWGARTQPAHHKATFISDATEAAANREALVVELEKFNKLLVDAHRVEGDGHGPFFLGDKFTFADLAIAPFLARFFLLGQYNDSKEVTQKEFPQLERFFEWKEAVTARLTVQKATPSQETLTNNYRKWVK